jgi:thiol-disulfide isomerase/thioredoxin
VRQALLLLLLAACAHAGQQTGRPLLPLEVRTLAGEKVRLDQLRGPALVDLWATWCVPCARALPFYARLARETGIRVVAISIDADDAPVREWMARNPLPFEVLRDPDGAAAEELGMRQMPTAFLLDAKGEVRERYDGFREEEEPRIEAEVRNLLGAR